MSPEAYPKSITLKNLDEDVYPKLIVGNFNRRNFILQNTNGNFSSKAAWLATFTDPTFSINTFKNDSTNKILIAFGKSRGGNIEFLETNKITALDYTINAIPRSGGQVTGAGDYGNGQICNLTATEATGYDFVNWTEGETEITTAPTYSFTVTQSRSLIALFKLKTFSIIADAEPTEGGEVGGAGSYNDEQTCNLTATAGTGYNFIDWTENGMQVSTDDNYSFIVNRNRTMIANFGNTTDIIAINDNLDINIFPNPTTGKVTIKGNNIELIRIFNIYG